LDGAGGGKRIKGGICVSFMHCQICEMEKHKRKDLFIY
jgi:hypothetical protein